MSLAFVMEPGNGHFTPWTTDMISDVRLSWGEGKSAGVIQKELNAKYRTTFTRNAVIGKVHRLELPKRASKVKCNIGVERRIRKLRVKKVRPVPTIVNLFKRRMSGVELNHKADSEIPQEQRKALIELGPRDCRFGVGDVGQPGFFFCGAPTLEPYSYCADHCNRCFYVRQR